MRERIAASKRAAASLSPEDIAARMAELKEIEEALAQAVTDKVPPQALALDPLLQRHRAWVSGTWGNACSPQAYTVLADVYAHPDFVERYEAVKRWLM